MSRRALPVFPLRLQAGLASAVSIASTAAVMSVMSVTSLGRAAPAAPAADCPPLGRLPTYVGSDEIQRRSYDGAEFNVQTKDDDWQTVKAAGRLCRQSYTPQEGKEPLSDLEIQSNYRAQLRQLGAQILYADNRNTTARLENKGQQTWFKIYSQETEIEVVVLEEKPFQASIQAPSAEALKTTLEKTGRAALYVNFDFGKASLKPDAAPALAQVTALLKAHPAWRIAVEGHTDNVGERQGNVKLSQERAAAVVAALVRSGIPAERLRAAGFGPDKPLAPNDTSEGRARNRRVELVKS